MSLMIINFLIKHLIGDMNDVDKDQPIMRSTCPTTPAYPRRKYDALSNW